MADLPGRLPQYPPDHDARMVQARRRAQWDLGDASWAGIILAAYLDPATDSAKLKEDQRV